jgi:hypothetical protein
MTARARDEGAGRSNAVERPGTGWVATRDVWQESTGRGDGSAEASYGSIGEELPGQTLRARLAHSAKVYSSRP